MYEKFQSGIWARFLDMLSLWANSKWNMNVVVGPVYDQASPYGILDPLGEIRYIVYCIRLDLIKNITK